MNDLEDSINLESTFNLLSSENKLLAIWMFDILKKTQEERDKTSNNTTAKLLQHNDKQAV